MKNIVTLAAVSVCLGLGGVTLLASQPAMAATLDFSGFTTGDPIPQTYGDISGVVNVAYRDLEGFGNSAETSPNSTVVTWGDGYSGLSNVAYGFGHSEIAFQALNGSIVSLLGFQLGSWPNVDRSSQVKIYNFDYSELLYDSGLVTVLGSQPYTFNFNFNRTDGFRLQFGPDSYNVGIDNVQYSATATPVPTPALLPGLVGLGLGVLRKRKAQEAEV